MGNFVAAVCRRLTYVVFGCIMYIVPSCTFRAKCHVEDSHKWVLFICTLNDTFPNLQIPCHVAKIWICWIIRALMPFTSYNEHKAHLTYATYVESIHFFHWFNNYHSYISYLTTKYFLSIFFTVKLNLLTDVEHYTSIRRCVTISLLLIYHLRIQKDCVNRK